MRPKLRTRFYRETTVGEGAEGFPVLLDGRPVRTPARGLSWPPRCANWRRPSPPNGRRSRTRSTRRDAAHPAGQLDHRWRGAFARAGRGRDREVPGTDLLFYRAEGPDGLVASQRQHWDPIVAWAQEKLGARFVLVEGVMHVAQPEAAIAAAAKAIPSGANIHDAWRSARSMLSPR